MFQPGEGIVDTNLDVGQTVWGVRGRSIFLGFLNA